MSTADWFTVDRDGLAALLERRGKAWAVTELVQNAWDADGCSRVDVTISDSPGRGRTRVVVADNSPGGFLDLTHAWTLFAPSSKKGDPDKRGRFNLGEKLVLSLAVQASIASTSGTVHFGSGGRRRSAVSRAEGSEFDAVLKMNKDEAAETVALLHRLIPAPGIATYVNGVLLAPRVPVASTRATLHTEVAEEGGVLRSTYRATDVDIYPSATGVGWVYEMGIPVTEWKGSHDVDVGQKVPLGFDRTSIDGAFLASLAVPVADALVAARCLSDADAKADWFPDLSRVKEETVARVLDARFGPRRVVADPSDPEATKRALDEGYTVVHGGQFSAAAWKAVRRLGNAGLPRAGALMPSGVNRSADGKEPIARSDWTPGMERIERYAVEVGTALTGVPPVVEVCNIFGAKWAAAFGDSTLYLNLAHLGHAWFDDPDPVAVDDLLLHEFAHAKVEDHLSDAYHRECTRLGAVLRNSDVERLRPWNYQ